MKFSKNSLELGPWSPSKVLEALSCPFKFNCGRERREKTTYPDDSAARVGTAIHSYIEILLQDQTRASDPMTYYALFSENQLTHDERVRFQLLKNPAEKSVGRILKFKKSNKCQDEKLYIEESIALTKDLRPTTFFSKEVFFRGKIDVAMVLPDNTIVVLDHKSSSSIEITDEYRLQLSTYLWLFFHGVLKKEDHSIQNVKGLYFLNSLGGNTPDIIKGNVISEKDFKREVEDYVITKVDSAALASKTNNATPGKHCKYCSFLNICPAGVKL